jgi:hypothetical protein
LTQLLIFEPNPSGSALDPFADAQIGQIVERLDQLGHLIAREADLKLMPYNQLSLKLLAHRSNEDKSFAQEKVRQFYVSIHKMVENEIPLGRTADMLRFTLSEYKLQVSPKLFDAMTEQDIVEAYDSSNMQIFRSLQFIELCNYSVLDVLLYEWPSLFQREDNVTETLMAEIHHTMTHFIKGHTADNFATIS